MVHPYADSATQSGLGDPESDEDVEEEEEQPETVELVRSDPYDPARGYGPSRDDSGCPSLFMPVVVVFSAFFGIAFYFVARPRTEPTTGGAKPMPAGTRDAVAPTILISIDGCRHEYLSRKADDGSGRMLAPTLNGIATKGVNAINGMQPVVPTKTFPNHWTIATGLYPENHGIVGNTMYDPVKGEWFHLNRIHPDWWYGTPIWQTIQEAPRVVITANGTKKTLSENYQSASVFWPGSEVPKHAPTVYWKYNNSIPYEERVERVLSLLNGTASDLEGRAQFVTLHLSGVDHAGHAHGPYSPEVNAEIKKADETIGMLLTRLGENWSQLYNVVVVSDHGMTEISQERSIDLAPSVKEGTAQDVMTSPMGLFLNMTMNAEALFSNIQKGFAGHEEHATAFLKQNLPQRWHLRESRLMTPVVTMATLGWTIKYPHQHLVPDTDKPLERVSVRNLVDKGNHGFDNLFEDMQAIFLARGPAFREGATVKNLRALDVYEMLCHVYGVQPAPNNGSLQISLSTILSNSSY